MHIRQACHALAVSPAGYYAHQHKDQRQRRLQDAELHGQISAAFTASRRTYGSPRIMHALRPSTRILISSGFVGEHSLGAEMDGLGGFLAKPYTRADLLRLALGPSGVRDEGLQHP